MKKYILVLILVLLVSGCSQFNSKEKSGSKETVKVKTKYEIRGERKDGKDAEEKKETVNIPKNPKRIVTFDYGAVDTIKSLGHESAIKGIAKGENAENLPEDLESFKDDKYGNVGELGEPNYDSVAKQNPDLIIFSGRTSSQKVIDELKKAAPKAKLLYIGTDDVNPLDSIKKNTIDLGNIFDEKEKAQSYVDKLTKVTTEAKNVSKQVNDNAMILLTSEGELSTYGPGDRFGGLLFGELGVKPADDYIKAGPHGKAVSFEYVAEQNPDVIFSMDRDKAVTDKGNSKKVLGNDVLKEVKAIENKKIVQLNPKEWYFSTNGIKSSINQVNEVREYLEKLK